MDFSRPLNGFMPRIDSIAQSLTQSLSQTNLSIGSTIDELLALANMSKTKEVACDSCSHKFSLLTRRKRCCDCNIDFCGACVTKSSLSDRKNHCKRCTVFNSVPLDRNSLLGLRVRDLRWYLAVKRISFQNCREKSELVDLILNYSSPQSAAIPTNQSFIRQNLSSYANQTNNATENQANNTASIHENRNTDYYSAVNPTNVNSSEVSAQSSQSQCEPNDTTEPHVETNDNRFNIDDLTNSDQLKELSVRQLKLILTRNFIDYRGCCEKDELLEKALRLWTDRQETKLQSVDDICDSNLCKICMECVIDCVLLDCGHMVTCTNCGKRLNECPICRQYVVRVVHIFKA